MENAGCAVAPDALRTFGERLETRSATLVDQIYLDAGVEFNLNSTRQLGEILFERLGLPAPEKDQDRLFDECRGARAPARRPSHHCTHSGIPPPDQAQEHLCGRPAFRCGPEGQPHPHAFSADGHGDRPPVLDRTEPAEHSGAHRARARAAPHVRRAGQGCMP